jgi:hypothetical protein
MIFAIWFTCWVLAASTLAELIVPTVVMFARSWALQQPLLPSPGLIVPPAILVFAVFSFFSPIEYATLVGVRSAIVVAFLVHVVSGPTYSLPIADRVCAPLALLGHLMGKSIALSMERRADVHYAMRLRASYLRDSHNAVLRWLVTHLHSLRVILVELVDLADRWELVLRSRGSVPPVYSWREKYQHANRLLAADLTVGIVTLLIAFIGHAGPVSTIIPWSGHTY